jgi:hypothetical protein
MPLGSAAFRTVETVLAFQAHYKVPNIDDDGKVHSFDTKIYFPTAVQGSPA